MYNLSKVPEQPELLSKEKILDKVTEYQIFAYYIDDFKVGKKICSPMRDDKNPSWKVTNSRNNRLYYTDYSSGEYGDCFSFVKGLFSLNFYQCLERIAYDMSISDVKPKYVSDVRNIGNTVDNVEIAYSFKTDIGVNKSDMLESDIDYWNKYGLGNKILSKYNVIKCSKVFLNGTVFWSASEANPIYAYVFFKDDIYTFKIYRPKAEKGEKWLSNTNKTILQGWDQLPKTGKNLIITKSLKDVMVLRSLGFPSIAMQNEVSSIKDTVVDELYSRFEKIFLLQDFDHAGVTGSNKLRKAYGFKCFFIQNFKTRGNGLKDISDYREVNNYENTKQLINKYINET